jgi:hypothetical protein
MALGQVIFGHPWFGNWLSAGLLAAALLLGVARVAATRLGAFRSIHRFQSLSFQLLNK